ncbi:MAG: dihydrodipicolinate synthase family protein [Bacilli bacterium]
MAGFSVPPALIECANRDLYAFCRASPIAWERALKIKKVLQACPLFCFNKRCYAKILRSLTALVTPMTELGVDYDALESLVESQIKGGVSGLVSVGTTA